MHIHSDQSLQLPASVMTIGALDGVHYGHQSLIKSAKKRAIDLGVPLVVYTFDPPPRVFFSNVRLLTPLPDKIKRLRILGVDHVVVAPFDIEYVNRNVCSFLEELTDLNPLEVWAGTDFHFGKNRAGNIFTLRNHFVVRVLEPVRCSMGEIISSSRIRSLMNQNLFNEAEQLLGWKMISQAFEQVN
ncbi:FAD synthetase family protein [Bacillus sp. 1NLA3E]|uniref:FAD synthetase family protein n=1 Tax=Bacillus sp. 1NLA3E TaxID=666686 RepID=UPI000247E884|nr:FAD synthetase family protein [Bacillus sp. 1NLA3E]AGK53302.1 riboflavin kinase/FMN adenylyltransferase [Bacillus sp. 1NLA3E]